MQVSCDFTPILDFIHVLSYLFLAARPPAPLIARPVVPLSVYLHWPKTSK